jgi:hypothetical protein
MPLLYTASDLSFARAALGALREAAIESYLTGEEDLSGYLVHGMPQYCVHIESEHDRTRANEILLALGAAPEAALPEGGWLRWLMIAVGVTVAALVALMSFAQGVLP